MTFKHRLLRTCSFIGLAVGVAAVWVAACVPAVDAANVTLTGNDAINTTSFNAAGLWSNAAAPSAANDYFTGAFGLRTPSTAGNYTFLGNSLQLDAGGSLGLKTGTNPNNVIT